jgi:hypothetical protein
MGRPPPLHGRVVCQMGTHEFDGDATYSSVVPRPSAIRWGTTHRSNRREVLLVSAEGHFLRFALLEVVETIAGWAWGQRIASFRRQFSFPVLWAVSTCRCVGRATAPVISRAFSM